MFFDNFRVTHEHGRILEENHYYAYGLRNASISSVRIGNPAQGMLRNGYQYQGEFNELDEDIGWNDFELRNYDAQIGRFIEQDPYGQFASPYMGMGNDPVNFVDPSGGFSINFGSISTLGRIGVAAAGAVIGYAIDKKTGGKGWTGAAIGAAVGLGATYIPPFSLGFWGKVALSNAPKITRVSLQLFSEEENILLPKESHGPFFSSNQPSPVDETYLKKLINDARDDDFESWQKPLTYLRSKFPQYLNNPSANLIYVDKASYNLTTLNPIRGKQGSEHESRILFGNEFFKLYAAGKISLGMLIRVEYHEFGGHVENNAKLLPNPESYNKYGSYSDVSEFISYYKMFMNTSLPPIVPSGKFEKDVFLKGYKTRLNAHYDRFTPAGKAFFKNQLDSVNSEIDRLMKL